MLQKKNFLLIAFASLLILLQNPLQAQDKYLLTSGSELKVAGTSTLHDWEMITKGATGEAKITLNGSKIESISALKVVFTVNSLKSGKDTMDEIAHETLKSEKHPQIWFELTDVQQITGNKIKAAGNLSIAGTTRPVILEVSYAVEGNTINFTSAKGIKFTDYKVDPPKAMFGTIKTGNDLQLILKTTFKAANQTVNQ